MIVGYARVSTDGQSVAAQIKELRGAGAEKIFREMARTGDGRARAVKNGVKLGRKPTLTHHQRQEAIKRRNAGKESVGEDCAEL